MKIGTAIADVPVPAVVADKDYKAAGWNPALPTTTVQAAGNYTAQFQKFDAEKYTATSDKLVKPNGEPTTPAASQPAPVQTAVKPAGAAEHKLPQTGEDHNGALALAGVCLMSFATLLGFGELRRKK